MADTSAIEYPCPECGYDGPHPVLVATPEATTFECGSCMIEVEVPTDG